MTKFFNRSDKDVIEDARILTVVEFVEKYKSLTTEMQLSIAYLQIRRENKMGAVVVQLTIDPEKAKPIVTKKVKDVIPFVIHEQVELIAMPAFIIEALKPKKGCKITLVDQIEKRTTRITELLKEKMKPKDIMAKLAAEGIKCHAPQITAIAQALAATKD